ncbi:MAG TPA: PEP-CTERM sorting domain-containing protein [Bryobacteraceae bacterium]|nr:PEP-CTERM sorting domain-containing protein [Bryobacteraceae bacterium]
MLLGVSFKSGRADTIYSYTGKPFTIAVSPYTKQDFVTAVIATQMPLAPNLPFGAIEVNSLNLSDGVQTIALDPSPLSVLDVATDAGGNINSWQLFLGYSASHYIWTQKTATVTAEAGSLDDVKQADNDGTPGVWSVSAAVPEPASVGLFAAGVLGLFAVISRKRVTTVVRPVSDR